MISKCSGFTNKQIFLLQSAFHRYQIVRAMTNDKHVTAWIDAGVYRDGGCPEYLSVMKYDGLVEITTIYGYYNIALTESGVMMCMLLGFAEKVSAS